MNNENQRPSGFFDKNTFLAIALSFGVFFLWQLYVSKKYPPVDKSKTETQVTSTATPGAVDTQAAAKGSAPAEPMKSAPSLGEFKPQTLNFDSADISFEVSSDGMGLKNVVLKHFTDRKNGPVTYQQTERSGLTATVINEAKNYKITKNSDTEFVGELVGSSVAATKTITVDPKNYLIKTTIKINSAEKQKVKLVTYVENQVDPVQKSFLLPAYEHQEFYIVNHEDEFRTQLSPEAPFKATYAAANLMTFNSSHFALVLANRSDLLPTVDASTQGENGSMTISYETPQPVNEQIISYDFYFGPKKIDSLRAIDENLVRVVDFGFFSFIGKPLHWIMVKIYGYLHNWGLAIILLTILIRTVLLPMNWYSFKSMRKMQKIQPKLQAIKEKFKNDPQRINQETLMLMKAEKANPLSGCLPALMQLPIFFALYPMIGNSFELYKQPFYFWINDLTLKDPFFVLPILAGLVFFVQTKMTPTPNMDPAQAKVMLFMPIVLSVFMLSAPSGLALYMFVNSLYGFIQQLAFTKEKTT